MKFKDLFISLVIICFLVIVSGCGAKGLTSSGTSGSALSTSTADLKLTLQLPKQGDHALLNPNRRSVIRINPNRSIKTIPSGVTIFQIHVYQHPPKGDTSSWEIIKSESFLRSEYPEDATTIEIEFDELPPGATKVYVVTGTGTELEITPMALNLQLVTLGSTGQAASSDSTLGQYSFIGDSALTVNPTDYTIIVPAGEFTNCVKVVSEITATTCPGANQRNYLEGTRTAWFKDGIGLVKMVYEHNDGSVTTARLMHCTISNPDGDFWPLRTEDNTWTYVWDNSLYSPGATIETITVDSVDGDNISLESGNDANAGTTQCVIQEFENYYKLNSMTQYNNAEYQAFPIDTWTVISFWGTNEKIAPLDNPAGPGDTTSTGITWGNVVD